MPGQIRSIERAATVLALLSGRSRRLGVVELAGELGLPKGTVFGILKTLRAVGFNELRTRARGAASKLALLTGESVRVAALHQNQVLILHQVIPGRRGEAHEALEVGNVLPADATALGRVLTANHGDEVSERGSASTIGGLAPGYASVAAPIEDRRGVTVGAIGIHGPMERLCRDRRPRAELVDHVVEAARAVSRELGAGPG
jgi:DNA-binding IclR family transcriptional regulator